MSYMSHADRAKRRREIIAFVRANPGMLYKNVAAKFDVGDSHVAKICRDAGIRGYSYTSRCECCGARKRKSDETDMRNSD